ncbi:MAG: cyclic nucleotide-binding domain-containing protein [Variovorax sp.]
MPHNDPSLATPDLRERAARLLMAAAPTTHMSLSEAAIVVNLMEPAFVSIGTVLMEEGEAEDTDYMALVLEGEVRAESGGGIPGEEVVISVLGPGSLIGEMGMLDGSPRSATCTALTDLKLATLSGAMLLALIEMHPSAAARLLLGISVALSVRLRESNRRLRALASVSRAVQLELDATHAVNRRLLAR